MCLHGLFFIIHVLIITLQITRAYKRKSGDGITSIDEMNTAVKEVLLRGKKCRTVAKAHAISEATLRRYSAKVQRVGNTDAEYVGNIGNNRVFSKAEYTMLADYTKELHHCSMVSVSFQLANWHISMSWA